MTEEEKQYFKKLVSDLQKKSDKLVAKSRAETALLIANSSEEMQRYIGALMEQYKWDMDAIRENLHAILKDVPEMKRMITIMFENMGKQEGDIEMLKEAYQNHEERLQKVESKS